MVTVTAKAFNAVDAQRCMPRNGARTVNQENGQGADAAYAQGANVLQPRGES